MKSKKLMNLKATISVVMRALLVGIAFELSVTVANGNPIARPPGSYEEAKSLKLTGEKVVVNVGSSESSVTGDYTFQATDLPVKRVFHADMVSSLHRPGQADLAFVIIAMPVIVPFSGSTYARRSSSIYLLGMRPIQYKTNEQLQSEREQLQYERWKAGGTPIATVGERVYSSIVGYPGDMPESLKVQDQLPVGWKLVSCTFNAIPFDASKNQVRVHISYTQPHFPGNVSAYLPILPDNIAKTNYLITFQAQEGVRFAPVAPYDAVSQPSDTNLSVRPANLQLLKVQVVPAGAARAEIETNPQGHQAQPRPAETQTPSATSSGLSPDFEEIVKSGEQL